MSQHAIVVGGGISGLATALALSDRGHRVTLLEGDDRLGGLGTTFEWRDVHLERFYHCLLPEDTALLARVRELGLEGELRWRETRMGFMYRKRVWPLNTPRDLLSFGPLTLSERLRMGLMGVRARFGGLAPRLDAITAEKWVRSQVGDRCFEILWKPLLSAKIGDHYPALPALWLSSRMNREKSTGPERKGHLTGGYRSLIDAFAAGLARRGVSVRLNARVAEIGSEPRGMSVALEAGGRESCDFVVCTLPLVQFQRLTRGLSLPAAVAELALDYQGVISALFFTSRPLSHYYWMPWVDSGATAQGAVEMSNLVPLERSHGLHVNYLVNYTHREGELFRTPDDALLARYRADLAALFPDAAAAVQETRLFRAPFVEPIWTTGYARRVPPTSVLPGRLYLACTAQVYPRVNSWNSCCDVVDAMMPRLLEEVAGSAAAEARS
ncbi:MAG TPA: FAD-dependent oxidoreductase [Candidatus Acidoferrales bacterium]|nr:FAD-dependent oxidoreductase [Candidatus Acidoferrales bacterium]